MTSLRQSFRGVVVALGWARCPAPPASIRAIGPTRVPPPPPGPVEVDLTQAYQRIDGFGASSAWTAEQHLRRAGRPVLLARARDRAVAAARADQAGGEHRRAGNRAEGGGARREGVGRALVAARRVEGQRLDDQRRLAAGRAPRRLGEQARDVRAARWPRRGFRWWRSRRRTSRTTGDLGHLPSTRPRSSSRSCAIFSGPALARAEPDRAGDGARDAGVGPVREVRGSADGRSGDGGDARPDRDAPLRRRAVRLRAGEGGGQGVVADGGVGRQDRQDAGRHHRLRPARRRDDSREPGAGQRQRVALLVADAAERATATAR